MLRLKGKGVPIMNSSSHRGDMYVRLKVTVPKKISTKAKDLLEQLSKEIDDLEEPKPIALKDL